MSKQKPRTGKPARVKSSKRVEQKTAKTRALPPLPPIATQVRVPLRDTPRYLHCSMPKVYEFIESGELESFTEGARRFVTARSIERLGLPEHERPALTKIEYVPLWATPGRHRRAAQAVTKNAAA